MGTSKRHLEREYDRLLDELYTDSVMNFEVMNQLNQISNQMKKKKFLSVGTKSVLFGAHCFLLHPFFVAWAWWNLYGFPWDPRLWVAFFVHDLGYWGKPNMDGDEGELHPYWGANLMGFLFGKKWFDFTLYHSRFLAKKLGGQYSKLCVADKYAFVITPTWLYLPMVKATGEIEEYMKDASKSSNGAFEVQSSAEVWCISAKRYTAKWVEEHKDIKVDHWTSADRNSGDYTGDSIFVCPHGLYQVFWSDGSNSLASVGSLNDGSRWLAPTNWTGIYNPTGVISRFGISREIEKMVLLKKSVSKKSFSKYGEDIIRIH